jgi:uncharacterized protein (TIGR02996 family)
MSAGKARDFVEFILAHPDDDAPRLVFADWLEEQGDSDRAEFIRVQVERARLPQWDGRQVRLRLREQQLLEQHRPAWRADLPDIEGVTWGAFRRGFVAMANFASFAVLKASASACWAATPIETVIIRWPRQREAIGRIPPIAGLRGLTIQATVVDQREVDRLANAPLLGTLRALNLHHCSLGAEGFRRLVASPHLGNLVALRVPFNSIGSEGVSALFDAVSLTSLAELHLSERGIYGLYGEDPILQATGLEALAAWPGLARVRSLILSGNEVGRDGLRALLRSPHGTGLKELALRANGLNGQAMKEFGEARQGLQLDVLDLGTNLLRVRGASYLASAPCLRELKSVELDRCEMPSSAARHLARAPFLSSLRHLNVNYNRLGPEGLHALFDANPQELHTLQMADNNLGDEGASHLAESPASDTLLEANFAGNDMGDPAATSLATSKHLRNLLILRLHFNPISKFAAAALTRSPLGKRLAVLEMSHPDEIPF